MREMTDEELKSLIARLKRVDRRNQNDAEPDVKTKRMDYSGIGGSYGHRLHYIDLGATQK